MSQLSLVPHMSIGHGLINEKLIENTLHVLDLEVVAGWLIEW
jgi:hypothetical protein